MRLGYIDCCKRSIIGKVKLVVVASLTMAQSGELLRIAINRNIICFTHNCLIRCISQSRQLKSRFFIFSIDN